MRRCLLVISCFIAGCSSTLTIEEIHDRALVIDAHADIEIPGKESRYVGDDGRSKVAPDKMRDGGVDAVVMAVAVGPMPRTEEGFAAAKQKAQEELSAQKQLAIDNDLVIALTADDLEQAHHSNRNAVILGFQNALILGEEVGEINAYFEAGVRVFALTHMGHNAFADSSRPLFNGETGEHEPTEEHGGLSALGREAVHRLNVLGAIIDVSQLSRNATIEVVTRSKAPVIASHSNVRALTDVSRNLTDEEITLIAGKGGVVHVAPFRGYLFDSTNPELDRSIREARRVAGVKEDYLYPFELYWEMDDPVVQQTFLATVSHLLGPGNVDLMLDHIDYIAKNFGVEHVGIGTDFNHGSGVAGFNDAREAMNVTRGLVERGYSVDDIYKIWGGNFLRVMRAVETAATMGD